MTKSTVSKKRAATQKKFRSFWSALSVMVFFLLLWVSQSVRSTQMSYQILKMEKQIAKEQSKRTELEISRDRMISLDAVEKTALDQLGLVVPKKDNIIVMTLPAQ